MPHRWARKLLRSLAVVVLLVAVYCDAAYCEVVIHTNMAGNSTCASYLKARSQRNSLPFELWLSGYLTGLATYDRKINNLERLQQANGEIGTVFLDAYCKVHPLDSYQIAAREMARAVFYTPAPR